MIALFASESTADTLPGGCIEASPAGVSCGDLPRESVSDGLRDLSLRELEAHRKPTKTLVYDLAGQRFGKITAKRLLERGSWLCVCDCGKECRVGGSSLRKGAVKSCGCSKSERWPKYWEGGLTQTALKSALHYAPESGVFTWLVRPSYRVDAGDRAGTVSRTTGYVCIKFGGRNVAAHRLAWFYVHGVWPRLIDHINLDRTDNRLANLRDVTSSANSQNTSMQSTNTSGFKGVSKHKNRWRANIVVNRKQISLGYFDSPEEASEAYITAKRALHPFSISGQGVRRGND